MDFRHVRAFIAAADALSINRAADRLHSALSPRVPQIPQLEHVLELPL